MPTSNLCDPGRSLPAGTALQRVDPYLAEHGVTRVSSQTGFDKIGVPVFSAVRPNGLTLAVHQGKGLSVEQAKISAIMEAIEISVAERVSQVIQPIDVRYDNPRVKSLATEQLRYATNEQRIGIQRRLVELFPFEELIAQQFIEELVKCSETSQARQTYSAFCRRQMKEFGTNPSEKFIRTVEKSLGAPSSSVSEMRRALEHSSNETALGVPRILVVPIGDDEQSRSDLHGNVLDAFSAEVTHCLAGLRTARVFAPHTAIAIRGSIENDKFQNIDCSHILKFWTSEFRGKPLLNMSFLDSTSGEILAAEQVAFEFWIEGAAIVAIAEGITAKIDESLAASQLNRYDIRQPKGAFHAYLYGQATFDSHNLKSIRASRKAFKRSIEMASDFVLPKRMLIRTYTSEWLLLGRPDEYSLRHALEQANQLIAADPTYSGAHWEKANALLYLDRVDDAVESISLAASFAPHDADLNADFADILAHACEFERSLSQIEFAIQLNPSVPRDYHWIKGAAEFFLGDYEAAIYSLSFVPNWKLVARLKAACFAMSGQLASARRWRNLFMRE